jgi:hypothetical protein
MAYSAAWRAAIFILRSNDAAPNLAPQGAGRERFPGIFVPHCGTKIPKFLNLSQVFRVGIGARVACGTTVEPLQARMAIARIAVVRNVEIFFMFYTILQEILRKVAPCPNQSPKFLVHYPV